MRLTDLRDMLGHERFDDALYDAAAAIFDTIPGINARTAEKASVAALNEILQPLLSHVWAEGCRLDWTGGVRHPNPYAPKESR